MEDSFDRFGRFLMKFVRDQSISEWRRIIDGHMKDETSLFIKKQLDDFSEKNVVFIRDLIPEIVDTTIHYLLFGIEQNDDIEIVVEDENGARTRMSEESDGLAGELYSSDGWIAQFSNEDVFNKKKI